jgi:Tol biopolymer transport system component
LHQNEEVKPPHKVRPGIPLDLETICLKSLEKEPEKRYGSCGELAADLGRWLEGEPIRARRMGLVERAGRLMRRNPVVAGLTAAVAASLLLGAVVATAFAARATQQEGLAIAAATQADQEKQRAEDAADRVEQEKVQVQREKDRADQKTEEATNALDQARQEKERADQKAVEAEKNEAAANEQKDKAEWEVYVGQITLAQREWEDGNSIAAEQHLNKCPRNLRDWEYRYLNTLFTRNQKLFQTKGDDALCFSPDGKRLVTCGRDFGTAKVWNVPSGELARTLEDTKTDYATNFCMNFSPDGKLLAGSGSGAQNSVTLKIWNAESGKELTVIPVSKNALEFFVCVVFSPDSKRLATSDQHGNVKVWDIVRGQEICTIKSQTPAVYSVSFSPDGKRLAGACGDGTVKVWDAKRGAELLSFKVTSVKSRCVIFSKDGKRIAVGAEDGTVKVWNVEQNQELASMNGHRASVLCLSFSPDGKQLATGSTDRTVKLWNAEKGYEVRTFKGCSRPSIKDSQGNRRSPDGEQ